MIAYVGLSNLKTKVNRNNMERDRQSFSSRTTGDNFFRVVETGKKSQMETTDSQLKSIVKSLGKGSGPVLPSIFLSLMRSR